MSISGSYQRTSRLIYRMIIHLFLKSCTNKSVLLRPNTKWYSEELRDAKRERLRAERLWRKTRLEVHRQIFRDTSSKTAKLLYKTKQDYFSKKIEECGKDNKQLFKLSKSLMGKKQETILPSSTSNKELANEFSKFFINKVATIRDGLRKLTTFNIETSLSVDIHFSGIPLMSFRHTTEDEVILFYYQHY